MLKLSATALLLSSALVANPNEKIKDFLEESFSNNPSIKSLTVDVVERIPVKTMKNWDAVIVVVNATVKGKDKPRKVKQKMIWFTDGTVITKELTNLSSGESLKDLVSPTFKAAQYKSENLIYGNANAKHKVAIFSDPLCPFCSTFVPKAIKYMKKQPEKFAVYYYHFPLERIHPAAVALSQAAVVAQSQGYKDVVLNMYKVQIDPREKDVKKILAAFNKTMKTNIRPSDLKLSEIVKHVKSDAQISEDLMVQGTPTMFFDGKLDKSKRKYERVK